MIYNARRSKCGILRLSNPAITFSTLSRLKCKWAAWPVTLWLECNRIDASKGRELLRGTETCGRILMSAIYSADQPRGADSDSHSTSCLTSGTGSPISTQTDSWSHVGHQSWGYSTTPEPEPAPMIWIGTPCLFVSSNSAALAKLVSMWGSCILDTIRWTI